MLDFLGEKETENYNDDQKIGWDVVNQGAFVCLFG